ncbi:GNAT family N-acetyltransferase [Subtercola sp. Z020]|uniref:GNAT family N-acetyltransferase n=1 Tax=Subtercola sp. Z020 TaxID=2080582 RepID=UPI00130DADC2|nr:GNAT family N-acetyltransferase [Subtercola sp. Z020]
MTPKNLPANPVLSALRTDHAGVALHHGEAYSYPPHLGPFAALRHDHPPAWADLAHLVDAALIERTGDFEPVGWVSEGPFELTTMSAGRGDRASVPPVGPVRILGAENTSEMQRLLEVCGIHTFASGSTAIAEYLGCYHDERLVAMAGLRFSLPGWREICCVATDPEFRGRGYARMLVDALVECAGFDGQNAFLFVETDNPARQMYRRFGFVEVCTRAAEYLTRTTDRSPTPSSPIHPSPTHPSPPHRSPTHPSPTHGGTE